jgi:hypothetical protein
VRLGGAVKEDRLPLDEIPQLTVDPLVHLTHSRWPPISKYETKYLKVQEQT